MDPLAAGMLADGSLAADPRIGGSWQGGGGRWLLWPLRVVLWGALLVIAFRGITAIVFNTASAPAGGGGTAVADAQTPSDTTGGTPVQPTLDAERPVQRRRPAVNSDGMQTGPLDANASQDEQPATTLARPRLSRHVDEPSSQTGPIEPQCGGWHKVDEPAPPPCPSDSGNTQQAPAK